MSLKDSLNALIKEQKALVKLEEEQEKAALQSEGKAATTSATHKKPTRYDANGTWLAGQVKAGYIPIEAAAAWAYAIWLYRGNEILCVGESGKALSHDFPLPKEIYGGDWKKAFQASIRTNQILKRDGRFIPRGKIELRIREWFS